MLTVLKAEWYMQNSDPDQDALKDLMAAVAHRKDRSAFEDLFQFFGPRIKAMMEKSGANADLAEDLVQDVMLSVWRKAELYSPEKGAVSTWIYTIARNARIDRIRRQPVQPWIDVDTVSLVSDDPGPEHEVAAGQRDTIIRDAVALLPPEQRRIVDLAFGAYKPHSEIAEELNLPIGTVKSRLRLAYKKLKEQLGDLR
jgi:RNA polymerase sigma-70 factor (ECF subfamily)